MSSFRVAPLARQSLTRFEGVKKPPSVSLLSPFELPLVEHKGRKRVCAFLPSVATFEVSNVSEGDCFAALQIAVGGFLPPYRFIGHAGRVTLPFRLVPFIVSFHDLRLVLRIANPIHFTQSPCGDD